MGITSSLVSLPASDDPFNAFCTDTKAFLPGADPGPLAGLSFAAKDIFDVAGHVCGCGNPDWKATHEPAEQTAWAVQVLVDAGLVDFAPGSDTGGSVRIPASFCGLYGLRPLARKAAPKGVVVAMETHAVSTMDLPEKCRAIVEAVGSEHLRLIMDAVNHFQCLQQVYHSSD